MSVTIRNADVGDAEAIATVHTAGLQASYRPLIPDRIAHLVLDPPEVAPRVPGWRRCIERPRVSTTLVACDGSAVVGFCTLRSAPGDRAAGATGEIWALFVHPAHWRRGVGRLLCERSLTDAGARGFTGVELWELESNETARQFFHSMGFRADGETRILLEHAGLSLRELRYRRTTPPAAGSAEDLRAAGPAGR
ncbi:MAG: GNAT family N-acetyltransferase [Acidobacteria bacterium]|nr:GNAT family N-acetyltransferase [Acidobacteriota bacterium]MYH27448.1 GNAT family N-acetyltransferase [Acidobacteriota bacterium]MYK90266.1 GNAT family N-acetyltransferase [Acidobacteriota bacterium]